MAYSLHFLRFWGHVELELRVGVGEWCAHLERKQPV